MCLEILSSDCDRLAYKLHGMISPAQPSPSQDRLLHSERLYSSKFQWCKNFMISWTILRCNAWLVDEEVSVRGTSNSWNLDKAKQHESRKFKTMEICSCTVYLDQSAPSEYTNFKDTLVTRTLVQCSSMYSDLTTAGNVVSSINNNIIIVDTGSTIVILTTWW